MTVRTVCITASVLLLTVPLLSRAQDSLSLDRLQARYDRLPAFRASFTQVLHSNFSEDSTLIRGQVWFQDHKYRVETPRQTVVTNGKTTWIYSPADSQVVINTAEERESRVTPHTFLRASTKKYKTVSTRSAMSDGVNHIVIEVRATQKSSRFTEATLWVRRSDRLVTRLRATDRNGSTFDLRLSDITLDPSLKGTPFQFSPPKGVETIDLRSDATN